MKTYKMQTRGEWNVEVRHGRQWVSILDHVSYDTAKLALDRINATQQANYRLHYLGHENMINSTKTA
ncbi:hypothetical protein [Furfurilactobacillus rossiae]|uniref:DUF2188 domain-containing protein n=1 Tax=Furfurilactobacillus rossiae DSM 15814 TaxID=1114972 RepID=A0A0R1RW59_9LACO|nr:hypothetical protein [Furfurilactobacillus rossiae]KRL57387.1 hypothetical protein FD35_GL000402 [Furfurilactobacillus rossiae DSM 15814]MCF6164868.1 hypothetical protein [Furfurilactobacillus rossiae]QFR65743.1 hypothetical protein LR814_00880 [Furfurilactobacillus rossiae]QLE61142.1 hypothetical protein LROSRS0_1096 [Furfurilactobacillus rossiae]QLE63884.1 hypothetical protein LROSL1_1066 [Furfurilactobacillus rossiae]